MVATARDVRVLRIDRCDVFLSRIPLRSANVDRIIALVYNHGISIRYKRLTSSIEASREMALGYRRTSIAKHRCVAALPVGVSRRDGAGNSHRGTASRAPNNPVYTLRIAVRQAQEPGVFTAPNSLAQELQAALPAGLVPMNGPCNASFLD